MKYIKKYENNIFEIGEYAVCIKESPYFSDANIKLKKDEKYKILGQDKITLTISDNEGNIEQFLKLHFLPEIKYTSNKYNL